MGRSADPRRGSAARVAHGRKGRRDSPRRKAAGPSTRPAKRPPGPAGPPPAAPGAPRVDEKPTGPGSRLSILEAQLSRRPAASRRPDLLDRAARAALASGDLSKARDYATRALETADSAERGRYGDVLHYANLVLGHVALAHGRPADAKRHLIAATKTPGSANIRRLGPNMALARELLERGEREVVLKYLQLCRRFWSDSEKLAEWRDLVGKGRVPDFGAHLDHGLRDTKEWKSVDTLKKLAKLHLAIKRLDGAREYATGALAAAESVRDHWNYGNVIHEAHLVLGQVALAEGDLQQAARHLVAAGRTPGSPQLRAAGPSMSLARKLLEKGCRAPVIEYLRLCGRFWKDAAKLTEWEKVVRGGGVPDFGALLAEGRL